MKRFLAFILAVLVLLTEISWGQSYLGLDGGFEGAATIDNTNVQTSAQANKWSKANTTQTIADEMSIVRSGGHALRIYNSGSTGRRVWSPLISISAPNSQVTIQYYRYVNSITNSQENSSLVSDGGTTNEKPTSFSYSTCSSTSTWEKVTFNTFTTSPYFTYSTISGGVSHRILGTGDNMYLDDFCIYTGSVDNVAPNTPTLPVASQTINNGELIVSWAAASGGVDNGGYLVLRKASSVSTGTPNVNGIYTTSNTIGDGTVVYVGTSTNFTDTGLLTDGTTYYYTVFTFDKAYNYSSGVSTSGNQPLPVELTSFTASATDNGVQLNWETATEVNNYGFNVERAVGNRQEAVGNWEKIAFVQGHGNSNSPKEYSFSDNLVLTHNLNLDRLQYRLKQIDFDGKFEYSNIVEVNVEAPAKLVLYQNSPNPFNPTTEIKFALPKLSNVELSIYNMLGEKIQTLANGMMNAGEHKVAFNASNLSSGVYLYKLVTDNVTSVKKMILMK